MKMSWQTTNNLKFVRSSLTLERFDRLSSGFVPLIQNICIVPEAMYLSMLWMWVGWFQCGIFSSSIFHTSAIFWVCFGSQGTLHHIHFLDYSMPLVDRSSGKSRSLAYQSSLEEGWYYWFDTRWRWLDLPGIHLEARWTGDFSSPSNSINSRLTGIAILTQHSRRLLVVLAYLTFAPAVVLFLAVGAAGCEEDVAEFALCWVVWGCGGVGLGWIGDCRCGSV